MRPEKRVSLVKKSLMIFQKARKRRIGLMILLAVLEAPVLYRIWSTPLSRGQIGGTIFVTAVLVLALFMPFVSSFVSTGVVQDDLDRYRY